MNQIEPKWAEWTNVDQIGPMWTEYTFEYLSFLLHF